MSGDSKKDDERLPPEVKVYPDRSSKSTASEFPASISVRAGASPVQTESQSRSTLRKENLCSYCKSVLPHYGYHYLCHVCGERFCYVHISRHRGAHVEELVPSGYGD